MEDGAKMNFRVSVEVKLLFSVLVSLVNIVMYKLHEIVQGCSSISLL